MIKEYELKTAASKLSDFQSWITRQKNVHDLRWDFPNLSKRDINPILYREKQIFRLRGRTPPIWFSIDANPVRPPAVRVAQPFIDLAKLAPDPKDISAT